MRCEYGLCKAARDNAAFFQGGQLVSYKPTDGAAALGCISRLQLHVPEAWQSPLLQIWDPREGTQTGLPDGAAGAHRDCIQCPLGEATAVFRESRMAGPFMGHLLLKKPLVHNKLSVLGALI